MGRPVHEVEESIGPLFWQRQRRRTARSFFRSTRAGAAGYIVPRPMQTSLSKAWRDCFPARCGVSAVTAPFSPVPLPLPALRPDVPGSRPGVRGIFPDLPLDLPDGRGIFPDGRGISTDHRGSFTDRRGSPTGRRGSFTNGRGIPTDGWGSPTDGRGSSKNAVFDHFSTFPGFPAGWVAIFDHANDLPA